MGRCYMFQTLGVFRTYPTVLGLVDRHLSLFIFTLTLHARTRLATPVEPPRGSSSGLDCVSPEMISYWV